MRTTSPRRSSRRTRSAVRDCRGGRTPARPHPRATPTSGKWDASSRPASAKRAVRLRHRTPRRCRSCRARTAGPGGRAGWPWGPRRAPPRACPVRTVPNRPCASVPAPSPRRGPSSPRCRCAGRRRRPCRPPRGEWRSPLHVDLPPPGQRVGPRGRLREGAGRAVPVHAAPLRSRASAPARRQRRRRPLRGRHPGTGDGVQTAVHNRQRLPRGE